MPPFEKSGVYCFAHVGRSVRRSRFPFRSLTWLCMEGFWNNFTEMLPSGRGCVAHKNQCSTLAGFWIISPFLIFKNIPFRSVTWSWTEGFWYYFIEMFPIRRRCVVRENQISIFTGFWIISPFLKIECFLLSFVLPSLPLYNLVMHVWIWILLHKNVFHR
jgi:hypothetical protein